MAGTYLIRNSPVLSAENASGSKFPCRWKRLVWKYPEGLVTTMVVQARSCGVQGLVPGGSGAIRATRVQSPGAGTPTPANSSDPVSASTTAAPDDEPSTSSSRGAGAAIEATGAPEPRAATRGVPCVPVEQAETATASPATSTTDLACMLLPSLSRETTATVHPHLPLERAIGSQGGHPIWGRWTPGSTDSRGSSGARPAYRGHRRNGVQAARKGGRHGRQRRGADASEEGDLAVPARDNGADGDDHRGRRDGGAGGSVGRPLRDQVAAGGDHRSRMGGRGQLGRVHRPAGVHHSGPGAGVRLGRGREGRRIHRTAGVHDRKLKAGFIRAWPRSSPVRGTPFLLARAVASFASSNRPTW